MKKERFYIISYDISDTKRRQKVFDILSAYGEWLQFSVFQCKMNEYKKELLIKELDDLPISREDHILLMDMGNKIGEKIIGLGKAFEPIERKPFVF